MNLLRFTLLSFSICLVASLSNAQDTFSIVAVDEATGEVGGAGATCLDIDREGATALIINDLLPGRGAIHTQAAWNATNQNTARARMQNGASPDEILDFLQNFDIQNNSRVRQYGIADFDSDGKARAAAFTGSNCFDEKSHIVGDYYAIQGNILIENNVLDSMEARFLNAQGSLAERLMAALQGANRPGADSRCLSEGVSSRSAFIRVAKRDDAPDNFHLDLHVPVTPVGEEPIDALQTLFDQWQATVSTNNPTPHIPEIKLFPNPNSGELSVEMKFFRSLRGVEIRIANLTGKDLVSRMAHGRVEYFNTSAFAKGVYFVKIIDQRGKLVIAKKLIVE